MDTTLVSNEHFEPEAQPEPVVADKLPPTKVTEIIGYVEPWIASPGEKVDVKVRADPFLMFIFWYQADYLSNAGVMHRITLQVPTCSSDPRPHGLQCPSPC